MEERESMTNSTKNIKKKIFLEKVFVQLLKFIGYFQTLYKIYILNIFACFKKIFIV